MEFKNKIIFIVSQDDWGTMFISKHHYAVELAKLGNKVYYINGPDQRNLLRKGEVSITQGPISNLFLVRHRFVFPYFIKFHSRYIFNHLVSWHIHKITKRIGEVPHIVWSFDLSNTLPLIYFSSSAFKIFMPVDEPLQEMAIKAAIGADRIFSVTNEIIEKYHNFPVPKHFINHGVSKIFFKDAVYILNEEKIKVGLSGNLLRPDIDRNTLIKIIKENPKVQFEFWGSTSSKNSNLANSSNEDENCLQFIHFLKTTAHVKCHGSVNTEELAKGLNKMDAFLICYDIEKDQSKGTNYHKILEYFATGNVVISNNVSTYKDLPQLITMPKERKNNEELPGLFKHVLNNLSEFNSLERRTMRKAFAWKQLYSEQIKTIANFCSS